MRTKNLLAKAPIMVMVVEEPEHIITFANSQCMRALGVPANVVGQPVRQAFAAPYKQHLDHLFKKVRQSGKEHTEYERHLRIRRGKTLVDAYFNLALQPVKDTNGTVREVCFYGMEVTPHVCARRKYQQHEQRHISAQIAQLCQQNDELKERNAVNDECVALASHQLRTPATGVKQYLGMVLAGNVGPVTPEQEEFLRQAYASNERQLSIISNLLHIAQIDAGKVVLDCESCDVNNVVTDVVAEQHSNIQRRWQTVNVVHHVSPALVWADPLRLRMVLDNLVDNASKYSREHTAITITIAAEASNITITIADEGVGIAESDLDKLFQKFTRVGNPLSTVVGGNGLGLYVVKKLVNAHGGSIAVASELQQGTTITLRLPMPSNAKV